MRFSFSSLITSVSKFDSLSVKLIKRKLLQKGEDVDIDHHELSLKTKFLINKHKDMWSGEIPKQKIEQVVNVFETGSKEGDYTNVSIYADGPKGVKQITYGRSQTTSTSYLRKLIEIYIRYNGKYASNFQPYLNDIDSPPYLVENNKFINLLKISAKEDPIMKTAQDELFDMKYWRVAFRFFQNNEFTYPLSMLVIYDSYIHGGLEIVRRFFPEAVPVNGGGEKEWIEAYLKARYSWLSNHQKTILHSTKRRPEFYLKLVWDNNWGLEKSFQIDEIEFS